MKFLVKFMQNIRAWFLEDEPNFAHVLIQNKPNLDENELNLKEQIWMLNLKCDPNLAPILHDFRAIFPAYHMNKRHWISVDLSVKKFKNLDKNLLFELIIQSYVLVKNGKI